MEESRTVGIWSWIFSIIVLSIPGLNILYILVLLFGGSKYKSKVNLARAYLLFLILCVIIYLGVFIGIYAYYNNSVDFNQVFENIKDNLQLIWAYIVKIFNSVKDIFQNDQPETLLYI